MVVWLVLLAKTVSEDISSKFIFCLGEMYLHLSKLASEKKESPELFLLIN